MRRRAARVGPCRAGALLAGRHRASAARTAAVGALPCLLRAAAPDGTRRPDAAHAPAVGGSERPRLSRLGQLHPALISPAATAAGYLLIALRKVAPSKPDGT